MTLGVTIYSVLAAFLIGYHYGYKKKAAEVDAAATAVGKIQEQALPIATGDHRISFRIFNRTALEGWRAFSEHQLQSGDPGPVCTTRLLNDGRLVVYSALPVSYWDTLDKLHSN